MSDTMAVLHSPLQSTCRVSLVGQVEAKAPGEGGGQGVSLTELKDQPENQLLSECSRLLQSSSSSQ